MANIKKENLKTWSEEAIDTFSHIHNQLPSAIVFSHMNAYGMLPMVIIKIKTVKFCLQKNLSVQEYDSNRYDYKINGIISEANSYEIITDKKIQRRAGVAQLKCFGQL